MTEETRPKPAFAGIVYGEIVYWSTVVGSIIAIIGSTIAVMATNNVIEPSYVFSAIWEGKDTVSIWEGSVGALPKGHWYLSNLLTGDGLTMFGVGLGVFSVTPGLFVSAMVLFKKKAYLFAGMGLVAAVISLVAFLGLVSLPG